MFDDHLPQLETELVDLPSTDKLGIEKTSIHKPRILLLYGSTRERSFSRLLVEEAARLLEHFGAETRIFNPSGLPLPDDAPDDHPRVKRTARLGVVVRGTGLVLSRASRKYECSVQGAD